MKEKKEKLKKIKNRKMEKLSANLRIAQSSTASMGKFDAKVHKDEVKKTIGKKKQKMANIFDPSKEVARNKGSFGFIFRIISVDWEVIARANRTTR